MPSKKSVAKRLRIRQLRSALGRPLKHRRTLEALGLRGPRDTVVKTDHPAIQGMISRVRHLVEVEVLEEE